ncbi:MAG: hypothetical protein ABIT01_01630, partial [Thermoanaerobaculia bacterium]
MIDFRFFPRVARMLSLLLLPLAADAWAGSADGLWKEAPPESILARDGGERLLFPRVYKVVALDYTAFKTLVAKAPLEFTPAAAQPLVLTLPLPDGSYARFALVESRIMDAALAARLPDVRTYRAQGIDDPAATARLDYTPEGFHGFILSPAGTVYIDPYRRGDTTNYLTY